MLLSRKILLVNERTGASKSDLAVCVAGVVVSTFC